MKENEEETKNAEPEIEESQSFGKSKLNIILKLLSGILLLSFGSNTLVNGSQSLATLLGVNEIIIGLTIVATGTSLPELVTSIIAAFKGKTDLAIGNVIGSNLLNQLLILGSCSIFSGLKGLTIDQSLIKVDLPFMVLTTFACLPIFWTKGKITRIEGFILLNCYIFYITDKLLFLKGFNNLYALRVCIFIYFAFFTVFILVKEKLIISRR